jgi:MFS family permease
MSELQTSAYKVYPYRWVILALYFFLNTAIQIMWATFFSITTTAGAFYGFQGADAQNNAISLLSIIFMIGVVVLSVPSFACFEKWGYRKTVSFGAILTGIGGLVRGFWGGSYTVVVIATIIFSIGQPFIINAMGVVAAKWFPVNERAIANSMGILPTILGMLLGMVVVPLELKHGQTIPEVLLVWGVITAVICVLYLIFTREAPPTPPCPPEEAARESFMTGLKTVFKHKNFTLAVAAYLFLMGVFNTFFTLIQPIINNFGGMGISAVTIGLIGSAVLIIGIVGGVIIPAMSDKTRGQKRLPFVWGGILVGGIGLALMMASHTAATLAVTASIYGFFCIGAAPVIMTYGAEAAYPVSEGTSEGLMVLFGSLGGAIFLGVGAIFGTNYTGLMVAFSVCMLIGLVIMLFAREVKK